MSDNDEIVAIQMRCEGQTLDSIAQALGVTRLQVWRVLRKHGMD